MARGWHCAKLSLSNAPRLSFSGLCILLFLFLSLCRFLCVCVFLLLSLELGRCSSDLFLSSRPRTGLATTYITIGQCEENNNNNRFCHVQNFPTSSVELIWPITELYTRDGIAEPVSRDRILRREREQRNKNLNFPCFLADHEQWLIHTFCRQKIEIKMPK